MQIKTRHHGEARRVGSRRAFTLVEVLVVVIIIGIAAAVVVPAMIRPGSLHVQAATRIVIADLLYAQNDAIAQQKPRRAVFDTANNRYRLTDAAGNTLAANWKGSGGSNYVVDFKNDSRFQGVTLTTAQFGSDDFVEFERAWVARKWRHGGTYCSGA
ncbi:MAG: prepilin-type N-terminal cleavage/methylation domain-containing protein [Phycisphaerales bacterium]|nr:prepilin-type N-terminal cleavage/methylation domain-containing protein [Phycisphaerales bacterium]